MVSLPQMPQSAARLRPLRRRAIDPASMAKAAANVTLPGRREARRPVKLRRASPTEAPRNERFVTLYSKTDCYLPVGFCGGPRGRAWLLVATGILSAASRFPDHPDHDAASRRQSGDDGQPGHGTARAAARTDPGADAYDLLVILRHQPDHPAIRPQP